MPLLSQPGSKWRYAYGYDLLGVLLFKTTGQSPDVWMKQVMVCMYVCELPFAYPSWRRAAHTHTHRHTLVQPHIPPHPPPHTQNLFDPLKMYDTGFAVPTDKINRYSTSYSSTPLGRLQFVFRPR